MRATTIPRTCAHCGHPLAWRAVVSLDTGAGCARCATCNAVVEGITVLPLDPAALGALRARVGWAPPDPSGIARARPARP